MSTWSSDIEKQIAKGMYVVNCTVVFYMFVNIERHYANNKKNKNKKIII